MKLDWPAFAERSRYRPTSIALLLASSLALAGVFVGLPDLLCFVVYAVLSISLSVITFHRLRNAGYSGAWVALTILSFGIGPSWHLSHSLTFNLGGLVISCVPVILAWFAPADYGTVPKSHSA